MDSKPFYTSKTFWFFILTLVTSVAGVFGFADFHMSAEQAQIAGVVVSVVGIVLRFVTSQGVSLK